MAPRVCFSYFSVFLPASCGLIFMPDDLLKQDLFLSYFTMFLMHVGKLPLQSHSWKLDLFISIELWIRECACFKLCACEEPAES